MKNLDTTYSDRFADAIARLCGLKPPKNLVQKYLKNADDDSGYELQNWILSQKSTPHWAQGIVILDAAEMLAKTPVEGGSYGKHLPQSKAEGAQ